MHATTLIALTAALSIDPRPPSPGGLLIATSSSTLDIGALMVILAGVAGFLALRRRAALRHAVLIVSLALAAGALALAHDWPPGVDILRAPAAAACFAAGCALFAWVRSRPTRTRRTDPPPAVEVWRAGALVTGALGAGAIVYVLVVATGLRMIDPTVTAHAISADGLYVLAALLLAGICWIVSGPPPRQPSLLLVLAALVVWWTSLMIPSASLAAEILPGERLPLQPGWWTWTFQLQFGLVAVLVIGTLIQDHLYRRRRKAAWPDRLENLVLPYSQWRGYIRVEALIAGIVLILGVYQIVRGSRPAWQLSLANALASLAAGACCLFMTHRRWSGNTAGLGMSLMTLAVVALAAAAATPFYPAGASVEYADRLPALFTAVLLALGLMAGLWNWLSRFWDQQLLDGRPWTTAGRMIPYAQRTGFLLTALAVLVAFQMTLWPNLVATTGDNSTPRILCGALTLALLAALATREGRRRDSAPTATLAVAFVIAAIIFVFIRLPASTLRGRLIQYDTVVLAALALPILIAAESLRKTRWRAFSVPLWFLALLILPMRTLLELGAPARLPAAWVRPAALGTLAAVYAFAGLREHRRAFLVLGAVLLIAALTSLYHL